ncbi:hypothetical protein BJ912DRAFT_924476 [Pholiota molesta]|nr:hypothetical protein BJ912DRAFT_935722 [Pholiota molesta]KAF8177874.1 hypothetical protein BJ912DRAFT_930235 [Pholiota molesta]KAF8193817.1 hypothetical protein BJ912DRAFT_924476 [Pholiota molesta]
MDEYYPWDDAKQELNRLHEARTYSSDSADIHLANINLDDLHIVPRTEPQSWRLSYFNTEDSQMEDAFIRLQGILCSKMLPPVSKTINSASAIRSRPHLRQAVTITGLGNTVFEHYLHNMEKAYVAFTNHFPPDRLEQWEPTQHGEHIALDSHTRTESLPFHQTVDPEGVLESMRGDSLVHAADNEVDYFVQYTDKDGQVLYKRTSPNNYRIGDIVEITMVILAYPAKDKKYKMVPLLRGVLLLNQTFRDRAAILRMRSRYPSTDQQIYKLPTKRKSAYVESSEVNETGIKLARMSL